MRCWFLSCFLAIVVWQVEMRRHAGSSIKAAHGDTMTGMESDDTYSKVADSLDNLGRSLEYFIIAGVHTNAAKGVLKFLPQISAILSGTAFAMKMLRIYTGDGESAMIKKLKASFLDVNIKLDTITSDLKNNRNLIKLASQRDAYIDAENKILSANENLRKYHNEMINLKCKDKTDCNAKQLLISKTYVSRLNVKREVDLILKGSTTNGVFGESLLTLTKESSNCDIKKIKITASIIAGLALKGKMAAMQYESLTNPSFDMISFEAEFAATLLVLENRKETTSKECFDKIDRYIRSDVNSMSRKNYQKYDIQNANKLISEFLQLKYFWIPFYVISLTADQICKKTKRQFWTDNKLIYDLTFTKKNEEVLSYVLIGSSTLKPKGYAKRFYGNFFFDNSQEHNYIQLISSDLLFVDTCIKGIVSYASKSGTLQIRDLSRIQFDEDGLVNVFGRLNMYFGPIYGFERPRMRLIALPRAEVVKTCSLECNSHGICNFLPHTKKMYCFCSKGFYGTHCEYSIVKQKISYNLNKLLTLYKLHIPKHSDLQAELQNTENIVRSKFQTSSERNILFSKTIGRITTNTVENINERQQWQNLVIQYADVIQNLQYFYEVMLEYATSKTKIDADQFLKEERLIFANFLINLDTLEKHLQMVNYLFIGRHDTPLLNHRSFIIEEMENNKADVCTDRYKLTLDQTLESLSSLQLQGYDTYTRARLVLGDESTKFLGEFKLKLNGQKKYLDDVTCNIAIPNSRNLENCLGGYYVYSGMKIDVACKDTFHLKGF